MAILIPARATTSTTQPSNVGSSFGSTTSAEIFSSTAAKRRRDGLLDRRTAAADGSKLKRHLRFFALGSDKVRQFSQGSTDNGKTWNVEYDFTYIRKK